MVFFIFFPLLPVSPSNHSPYPLSDTSTKHGWGRFGVGGKILCCLGFIFKHQDKWDDFKGEEFCKMRHVLVQINPGLWKIISKWVCVVMGLTSGSYRKEGWGD